MSGKRAKQNRRELNELFQMLEPIKPIFEEALNYFDDDIDEVMEWAVTASLCHDINPNIDLDELLPNKLAKTVKKYKINEQIELLENQIDVF